MNIKTLAILAAVARAVPATCEPADPSVQCDRRPGEFVWHCYSSASMIAAFQKDTNTKYPPSAISKPSLRGGDMSNLGDVIHYKIGSWELSRDEVVNTVEDGIDGDEVNFQLNITGSPQLLHIIRDNMTVSVEDIKSHQFTIKNAFLDEFPDKKFEVNCPASKDGNTCIVKQMAQQDEAGNDLVTCFAEESIISKEDIPTECKKEMYNVTLHALTGPHFILAATKSLNSSSDKPICPQSLAFSTMDGGQSGKKQIVSPKLDLGEFKDLSKHHLGVAALADILKAEENAEAIDKASYDVLRNNCVTYASSIWRHLEFVETEDLANFLVENIIVHEAQLEKLASKHGGRMLLKAMSNEGLKKFWSNIVYSQLYLN